MEKAIRNSLKTIYNELKRAAAKYPPLYHQQLIRPYVADPQSDSADSDPGLAAISHGVD